VTIAIDKAVKQARKNIITVPIVNDTIPHWVRAKVCAADVLLRPAPQGKGLLAGGSIRAVLSLAGIHNASTKMLGSNNKISNVRATIKALQKLRK